MWRERLRCFEVVSNIATLVISLLYIDIIYITEFRGREAQHPTPLLFPVGS